MEVTFTDKTINIIEEGYDVSIHIGPVNSLSVKSDILFSSHFQLVASPKYIAARGEPKTIDEISKHDCVIFGRSCTNDLWPLKMHGELKTIPVRGRYAANHISAVLDACIAGNGIALLPKLATTEHLISGELMEILPKAKNHM